MSERSEFSGSPVSPSIAALPAGARQPGALSFGDFFFGGKEKTLAQEGEKEPFRRLDKQSHGLALSPTFPRVKACFHLFWMFVSFTFDEYSLDQGKSLNKKAHRPVRLV
ncbi:MAG: hypothetical protein KZQ95_04980 [Candidatus Thiodiazotropha sp. (ex Epidulcina cf. delphinae)]|nr:hypothetical protein [Candidatus Thiodiazotropha sp. (ex Epidulcina cf. delphinae)]